MNQHREQYGDLRLRYAFSETENIQSAEEAIAFIQSKVNEFAGSEPQHDDLTMVYIQISER